MSTSCQSILVVEDDEAICQAIKELLELEGYSVVTARNGKEALDLIKTLTHPCLILLDLMLPVMNGWELLNHLKGCSSDMLASIPVVITSAAGTAAMSAAKQAEGYIKKPIDIDILLRMVQKYCKAAEK